jgi:putrescine transport system ATP-binding protein
MIVADRIGLMDSGRLMQVGTPADIYERPASRWVADFMGDANVFEGRVGDDRRSVEGTAAGRLVVGALIDAEPRTAVWAAVRPERMCLTRDRPPISDNCLSGLIVEIGYLGDMSIYQIRIADGSRVTAAVTNSDRTGERTPRQDEQVWLSFSAEAPIVLTR